MLASALEKVGKLTLAGKLAALLLLLGGGVMLGWALHNALLVQIFPGLAAMAFNTALSFALLGSGLLVLEWRGTGGHLYVGLTAALVLLIATLNFAQIVTGRSLGIDFPALQIWAADSSAPVGRMSVPTAISFFLASSCHLLRSVLGMRDQVVRTVRAVGALLCVIGIAALVGYALKLELLYRWYAFNHMALHTAFGVTLLGVALWSSSDARENSATSRADRRIILLATWAPALIASLGLLTGIWVIKSQSDSAVSNGLVLALQGRTDTMTAILVHRSTRAAMASLSPALLEGARALKNMPSDNSARAAMGKSLASFESFGFSSIRVISSRGALIASVGAPAEPIEIEVPVKLEVPGQTSLLWRGGFVLRHDQQVDDGTGETIRVVTEQPLPAIAELFAALPVPGSEGELKVCAAVAAGPVCFPSHLRSDLNAVGETINDSSPIGLALRGRSGEGSFPSRNGGTTLASYRPVGETGLVAVIAVDSVAFLAPMRQRLLLGLLLVAAITLSSSLTMSRGIRGLIGRLRMSQRHNSAVVESLQEGLMLISRDARILSSNPAADRILGYPEGSLCGVSVSDSRWRVLGENGRDLPPEEFPITRTIRTGAAETDVKIGVYLTDHELRWLSVSTAPLIDQNDAEQGGIVLSFADVTAQHEAEKELQALSHRFERMIDSLVGYSIFMLDPGGRVTTWNRGAELISGYLADEIVGRHFSQFFSDEDRAAHKPQREIDIAAATGRFDEEGWRQRKDGSRYWASIVITAVRNAAGELIGYTKIIRDLSVQRAAEQKLRDSEERFRLMVDGVGDYAIFMLNQDGKVMSWNRGAFRVTGFGGREIVGRAFSRFYSEDDVRVGKPERELADALNEGRFEEEGWRRRKDGSRYWASSVITPVRQEGGGLLGFSVVIRDLSERRVSEQKLRDSEESHRTLIASAGDGILALDGRGVVESANPAAERMFGRRAEALIGRSVGELMPGAFPDTDKGVVARFAAQYEAGGLDSRREVCGLRADGTEFPLMLALNVVCSERERRYVALLGDLTEHQRAQRALGEAHRRVQAMIECSPFSIVTWNSAGIIESANPAAERLTLYALADLAGSPLERLHDGDEIRIRAAELSGTSGRPIEPGVETFVDNARRGLADEAEWHYVRRDGSRVLVHLSVTAMRDADDRIVGYMGVAYDITERKRREEYTQHVATHDFLTGLPTRSLLADRLQVTLARARRSSSKFAVLMLDLDHFKRVNDSLGHHVGDELLKTVADRLKACVRQSDTVARMGGDEFVVLLNDLRGVADVERVANEILAKVAVPVRIGNHELEVTPSVGIAVFPTHGETQADLLRRADSAMYEAKTAGRHGYRFFTPELEHEVSGRLEIEADLRRALERNKLEMHYQPVVCLTSGRVLGMEALLRWNDPVRGSISPSQFIPIAEESGLILPLGDWVLRTACREARQLQILTGQPLRLAVNVSPSQFLYPGLLQSLEISLQASGLAPEHLELEITEGMVMKDTDASIARLSQIRSRGIRIAIDDFGTGFSSLSYVTRLPMDTLKIDRAFIANIGENLRDAAVVEAVITLARKLKIRVVAEGVETAEQLAFLVDRCCDAAQGSLLGEPMVPDSFGVQGFHFAKACSAADFALRVAELNGRGSRELSGQLH